MRKLFWSLLLFFLAIPITYALTPNYQVLDVSIKADILSNGDMKVSEMITLKGAFNGYIRDLYYQGAQTLYDATALELINVSARSDEGMSFISFEEKRHGEEGEKAVYERYNFSDYTMLKMFWYNQKGVVTFKIDYTLKDVVVVHNDVAECYWTFIGEGFDDDIKVVYLEVNLPNSASELRAWAHGPLNGEIDLKDSRQVVATVNSLGAHTLVDLRMMFDKGVVPGAKRVTNLTKKDEILAREKQLANEANKDREQARFLYYGVLGVDYAWFIGLLLLLIYIYLKYDRERRATFNLEYYREFPATYGPEIVEYLLKHQITTTGLVASLLSIIQKGGFKVEQEQKNKDYTLIKKTPLEPLTKTETYVQTWMLKYGVGEMVTLKNIKGAAKKETTARGFLQCYQEWVEKVKTEAVNEKFFEDQFGLKLKLGVYFILGMLIVGLNLYFEVWSLLLPVLVIANLCFLFYLCCFKKRTQKGNEDYVKWGALKKFLLDFGRFQEKELPAVILWEKYLVYATVFGIAKEVQKTMAIKIKEFKEIEQVTMGYPFLPMFSFNHVFAQQLNRTLTTTKSMSYSRLAQTRNTSGSGFGGGGFSGGGGFGGGGTGGGGRGF